MSTATAERWLAWDADRGFATEAEADSMSSAELAELLVADSWLVEHGEVRDLVHHQARFTAACAQLGVFAPTVDRFWQQAVAELPRTGAWFPRVELRGGPASSWVQLGLRLRPAPPLASTVRVLLWPAADPRRTPCRKGPDLPLLAELKAAAQTAGADDALLIGRDGRVLESTTASLLWWEGDLLCLPDAEDRLLPGVTAELIVRQATDLGIEVRRRPAGPADLNGREAWLVNALHGIRPVTAWTGTGLRPGPAERAPNWQRLLATSARPLPTPHGEKLT
ncbi:aminotransferase class IV [Kitasatospora azatica]|uniref:aminotransferase class IV n=1 Tax=Kitasatospora azatica TaxID=58347 RepID=UPI000A7B879B|nr:aminotransferase class IV [Kitasatospora azatica]